VTVLLGFLLLTFGCDAPEEDVGDVLMLPGDFVCETCGLELSEMRVLGSAYGPDAFDNIGVIVRAGSDGRIYAANEFGSHVKVFDDNGLVAQLGQRGAGPGEFMMISTMDIEDDGTLHVFDAALERHTIFGPTLELQSSKLLDIRPSHAVMVLPDGESLLVASSVPTQTHVSPPVHLLNREGKVERSFGSPASESSVDLGMSALRLLAASGDTAVWVAHWNRYRLELWDLREAADTPLLTIERQVSWFPPGLEDSESVDLPPASRVIDIQETGDGEVMTVLRVPDPNWAAAVSQNGGHKEITDPEAYFDTIVEVLDPRAGKVVVSVRRTEVLGSFAGPGFLTAGALDNLFIPRVKLLRVQFQP
jgi:hypothetical protein